MLEKKKILITGGASVEKIDPVRYISNFSSGKQAVAFTKICLQEGAFVTLIAANIAKDVIIENHPNLTYIKCESADEIYQQCLQNIPCDIAIFAAAISDWKAKNIGTEKIKKPVTGQADYILELTANIDILKSISNHANRPNIVIGFAAETENLIENAQLKLANKGCDYILANNVKNNVFSSEENKLYIISKDKIIELEKMQKIQAAKKIMEIILNKHK